MNRRTAWWFLGAAVIAALVYPVLPITIWKEPPYNALITACVLATAASIALNRRDFPKVWLLFLGGTAGICAAEWMWFVNDLRGVAPFPSWSEYFDLGGRVLLLAGIIVLITRRGQHRDMTAWADAVVFGVAIGSVAWIVAFRDYFDSSGIRVAERLVTIGYLTLDVAILAGFLLLLIRSRGGVTALRLLASGVAVLLATDFAWLVLQVHGSYSSGHFLDIGWPIACACIAAAAMHPTMHAVMCVEVRARRPALPQAIAFCVAMIAVPTLSLVVAASGVDLPATDEIAIAVTTLVVAICVTARFVGLLRLSADETAASAARRTEALVRESQDVIAIVDRTPRVVYVSEAVEQTLGWSVADVVGLPLELLALPEDRPRVLENYQEVVASDQSETHTYEMRILRKDDSTAVMDIVAVNRFADPDIQGIVLTARDISDRRRLEDELVYRAFHDTLTGLANRRLLLDHVTLAINNRRVDDAPASAVVVIDLDDFKTVNDELGHAAGDDLLVAIGERLTRCVRPGDTVARLGGDEFALLLVDAQPESLDHIATRILEILALPLRAGATEIATSASIGIRLLRHSDTAQLAVRDADIAMYSAKTSGKARYAIFDLAMGAQTERRLALKADLRGAWRRGEISVAFQPIVDISDGRLHGAEALMRWTHPLYGAVAPTEFIAYAEETGIIRQLGLDVLRESARCAARWRAGMARDFCMSVNVSPAQLGDDFVGSVDDVLAETGLEPGALVLEVTESVLVSNFEDSARILQELRDRGIRIAIDDFGTGYASLKYAHSLPVDLVKIDRTFTSDLGSKEPNVVPAVMQLAQTMHAAVVAEGIETDEQAAILLGLACTLGQGHLYAPALPEATFRDLVQAGEVHRVESFGTPPPSTAPDAA